MSDKWNSWLLTREQQIYKILDRLWKLNLWVIFVKIVSCWLNKYDILLKTFIKTMCFRLKYKLCRERSIILIHFCSFTSLVWKSTDCASTSHTPDILFINSIFDQKSFSPVNLGQLLSWSFISFFILMHNIMVVECACYSLHSAPTWTNTLQWTQWSVQTVPSSVPTSVRPNLQIRICYFPPYQL